MIADVDAASILTGMESGVAYHYDLIWVLLLLIVPLFFVQEAAGRIGVVTGKGLGELVRQYKSRSASVAIALPVAAADVASYVAEYAAIGLGFGIFGVPLYVSLPTGVPRPHRPRRAGSTSGWSACSWPFPRSSW